MKRLTLGVAVVAAGMTFAGTARAQFVVSDPTNLVQNTLQAASAIATAADLLSMLTMMTAAATITALSSKQDYPNQNQLGDQLFDPKTPASTTASKIVLDEDRKVTGTDASGELLKQQITGSANLAGIAAANLDALEKEKPDNPKVLPNLKKAMDEVVQETGDTKRAVKEVNKATLLVALGLAQLADQDRTEAAALRRERAKTALIFAK